ncbi:putative Zinc finger, RING/FYVE/PHD-type [Helianthus anomalus]
MIQKWFGSGNLMCPKTGEKVSSSHVVSNLCIRSIIKQYYLEKEISMAGPAGGCRNREVTRATTGGSVAAEAGIKMAVDFLVFGTKEAKYKACYEVRLLSKSSTLNRACLVEGGCGPEFIRPDLL